MKKYLFIFFSVCFSICAKSQGYQELFKVGNKWNFLYEMYLTCYCGGESRTYSLTLSNDTLIENKNYKKMLCTIFSSDNTGTRHEVTRYVAAVREDIDKQIVYARYPEMDEQMLFTFNRHTGDTLLVKDIYKDQWTDTKTVRTVKKIERYNIGGLTGKMITISDTTYSYYTSLHSPYKWSNVYESFSDIWYEGIGSMNSLIDLSSTGIPSGRNVLQLLCFWKNDDLIYHQEKHTECLYALWTGINDIPDKNEIIYPNPTNGKLIIDNDLNVSLIQIFNTEGNKMLETKNKNIDISGFTSGLYFVKIHTESGIMKVQKIIKQE